MTAAPITTPARGRLENFDAAAVTVSAKRASVALPADAPGVVTSVLASRGVPHFVFAPKVAPPASAAANTPIAAARAHLARYARAYRLSPAALDTVVVRRVHNTGRGGIIVELGQDVAGVEVFRDALKVMMTRDLELVALSGALHPVATPTLLTRNDMQFTLSATDALSLALTDLYDTGVDSSSLTLRARSHGYELYEPAAGTMSLAGANRSFSQPARIKKTLFNTAGGLVPAYVMELDIGAAGSREADAFRYVISASDGQLLYRHDLTVSDSFTYRVWADTTPPFTPGDSPMEDTTPSPTVLPSGFEPSFIAPSEVTIEGFNTNPSGGVDPWLPAGATETNGNNVDSYADHANPDGFGAGDTRADVTAPGVFARTYDTSLDPLASPDQIKAAVTQLFYVNNWLHDYFYDSGFDEAAGNAQADNLGRGGLGGDVLLAEAQDTAGQQTNNANMSTFADGASPRMQMYIFDLQSPKRDGTIDNGIVAHEWGHYIDIRLGSCGFGAQCGAVGEGWGDYFANMMAIRPGDDYMGSYATAPYASKGIGSDAAFFGIRRVAYSANFDVNALTFRHISDGVAFPAGMPASPNTAPNSEVHNAGEVWATVMQEVYVAMLREGGHSFDEAKRRMADYVVAGLKMTPASATFTERRDTILAAAAAADANDLRIIAQAFARRGMGTGAVSPPRTSTNLTGVVEDFEVKGSLGFNGSSLASDTDCDGDGLLDASDTGELTVAVLNVGAADLANTTATVSSTNPAVLFPAGTTLTFSPMGPFQVATASLPVQLDADLIGVSRLGVTVTITDPDAAVSPVTAFIDPRVNYDRGASRSDDVESMATAWVVESAVDAWERQAEGTGNIRWTGVEPAGIGDEMLVSPPLEVSATEPFVISFSHRYEFSTLDVFGLFQLLFGGGVLEYSTNDGSSWADLATLVDPGYNDTLTPLISDNPIAGRRAFTRTNPGGPVYDRIRVDLGTRLAGQTVLLRFRLTSAGGVSAPGWEIDELSFSGIDNEPFTGPIDDSGCVTASSPVADAGDDQAVEIGELVELDGSGSRDPDGDALSFAWTQTAGPMVALSDVTAERPSFTAPTVTSDRTLTFALRVVAGGQRSLPDTVDVLVMAADEPPGDPDAGVPPVDEPDAGVPPTPSPDAGGGNPGDGGGSEEGGCGCRAPTSGRSGAGSALLLLGAIGLVTLRRRRR